MGYGQILKEALSEEPKQDKETVKNLLEEAISLIEYDTDTNYPPIHNALKNIRSAINLLGDQIDHPVYYLKGDLECKEVMKTVFGKEKYEAFCLLTTFTYLWRQNDKGGLNDLKKAAFYLNEIIGQ